MPVPESFKKKYSLCGEQYPAQNADRAIQDLFACITRLHTETEAAKAHALDAEEKARNATAEAESLKRANTDLGDEIRTLKSANARLTSEAERLDKKLADIGVTVSANDKKLAESYEKLCTMTEKAEKLCAELGARAEAMYREMDRRICELCNAAASRNDPAVITISPAAEKAADTTDAAVLPDGNNDVTDETEDQPAPEELPDDELSETSTENDPNLFNDADTDQTNDASDDDNMISALKQAIENSKNDKKAPAEPKKETDTEHTASSSEAASEMSDAEIKDMLAAMYSEPGTDDVNVSNNDDAVHEESSKTTEIAEKTPESKSGFGNMKSSLDAIRRRLGK